MAGDHHWRRVSLPAIQQTIDSVANFGLLVSNVFAYTLLAILFKLLFSMIKRASGEKLVQADTFGNFEYYLGMLAGAVRFFCILLFVINFLHAKFISDAERAATAKVQADNFGSISFPTFGSLQQGAFYESPSGKLIRKHLRVLLLDPAVAGGKRPGDTMGKRRERAVDEVLK